MTHLELHCDTINPHRRTILPIMTTKFGINKQFVSMMETLGTFHTNNSQP